MRKHLKVEGHNNLVRDTRTGVVLNINKSEATLARERKRLRKEKELEHEVMKNDVDDIKKDIDEIKSNLEQSLSPTTKLLMAAEVDHTEAGQHKVGVGLSIQM